MKMVTSKSKNCSIEGCNNKKWALEFCDKHYRRFKRYGDPHKTLHLPHLKYRPCNHTNCGKKHFSKGYCKRHLKVKIKFDIIFHYSHGTMTCACCGEDQLHFLSIDHPNNDGAAHRKAIGRPEIYRWLIKNNYPEGFQVLCFNCNIGKKINDGICPHEVPKLISIDKIRLLSGTFPLSKST